MPQLHIITQKNIQLLYPSRYDIVTQIMQATTLQNVKRAKGVDIEVIEKSGAQNISRQQIADAKKLKRYINQLTIAKAECETALRKLGWDGAFPTVESDSKVRFFKMEVFKQFPTRLYMYPNEKSNKSKAINFLLLIFGMYLREIRFFLSRFYTCM